MTVHCLYGYTHLQDLEPFCAMCPDPEHQAAISLFVGRQGGSPSALFFQLPVRARKSDASEYPPQLRRLLEGLDIPASYRLEPNQAGGCSRAQVIALLSFLVFLLVVGLLIFATGLLTILRSLFG